MMKKILITVCILLLIQSVYSQSNRLFSIKGEGTDDKVSLLFEVKTWPDSLDGFIIKKRVFESEEKVGGWKSLDNKVIIPGNSLDKKLTNITNNASLVQSLYKLREVYFSNTGKLDTKLSKVSADELKKNLSNQDFNQIIKLLFAYDYNIALMYGFAYVDYKVPNKAYKVEYGLFPVFSGVQSNDPIDRYSWLIGSQNNLNLTIKNQKIKRKKNTVALTWQLNRDSIDNNYNIAGFNIYRKTMQGEYSKINDRVIWLNRATQNRIVYYKDSIPNRDVNYLYALVPVSLFNTEGSKYEMLLNSKIPDILPAPLLKSDIPYGHDFIKEGVRFSWQYDTLYTNSISGFLIKRMDNVVDGFIVVSDTLKPSERSYFDRNVPLTSEKKYYYKLVVLQENSFPIESKRLTYVYDPITQYSERLKGIAEIKEGNVVVNFSWSQNSENTSTFKGYQLKSDFGSNIMASINSMPLINDSNYSYKVEGAKGKKYRFTICAVDYKNRTLPYTDTISVVIPALHLPSIRFSNITVNENSITLNWSYADLVDLAGFRIYNKGEMVLSESEIMPENRSWTFADLEPGKYDFTIQAISKYGVKSEVSFYHKKAEIK